MRRILLPAVVVFTNVIVAPGLGCSDTGAASPPGAPAAIAVRALFPEHAGRVLGSQRRPVTTSEGLLIQASDGARDVELTVPERSGEPLRIIAPGGFGVRVWEVGRTGDAARAEGAIAYSREGGVSFWVATGPDPAGGGDGVEEWLLLEPAEARGDAPAVTWIIEGATPKWHPSVVELVDAQGRARLRVTAPEAFTASGRPIPVSLRVEGGAITLHVDGRGEAVLVDPKWVSTADMQRAREDHVAALLPDGRVFVAGGAPSLSVVQESEMFDPATLSWSLCTPMIKQRHRAAAVTLPDGRVLVVGGISDDGSFKDSPMAEIYDPGSDTWSVSGAMSEGRHHPGAALLPDGRVLVVGGRLSFVKELSNADIYDPQTATWTSVGPMTQGYGEPTVTVLPNGDVFVVGGGGSFSSRGDIFHPATGVWEETSSGVIELYGHTATLLPDGTVLVAGGTSSGPVGTVQIYNPGTNTWSMTGSSEYEHQFGQAVLLPSGKVLLLGGYEDSNSWTSVEVYEPQTGTWSLGPPMSQGRAHFPAVLLLDGRVLVSGGDSPAGGPLKSAAIYTDGSLGTGCNDASHCNSGFCVDGACCDTACGDPCHACSIAAGAPANGTCALANGAPCEDGDLCTQGDSCDAGVCITGAPVECPPGACNDADACDPATGMCVSPSKPDGTPCDDGDACTPNDACQSGTCIGMGAAVVCPSSPCVKGACDPATGQCVSSKELDGTPCGDGDPCSIADLCEAGTCSGIPVTCAPPEPCHLAGTCDPNIGACISPPAPDGTPCDSGACIAGICLKPWGAGGGGSGAGGSGGGDDAQGAGDAGACSCDIAGGDEHPPGLATLMGLVVVLAGLGRRRERAVG
jgi:hypothetical protein